MPANAQGHEDIDQCFGQLSALMALGTFDSPEQLIDLINGGAGNRSRNQIRGKHVFACTVDQTACWKDWVRQLAVKLKGLRYFAEFTIFS